MGSTDTDRRRFLQLCGAGVALAAAGCLDGLGGDDSNASPYADTLVSEDGVVFASYTAWETDSLTGEDSAIGGNVSIGGGSGAIDGGSGPTGGDEAPQDPLLAPVVSPLLVGFAAGFGVGATPLAPLLGAGDPLGGGGFTGPGDTGNESEQTPEPASFETEISALLLTVGTGGTALQIRGDIDTEEVDGLLQGSADDGALLGYTRTGEQNGYTRYEPETTDGGNSGDGDTGLDVDIDTDQMSALAVGSDEILLGGADSIDRLTDDGAESAVSEFDSLAWLLEAAGDGEAGLTVHAPEGNFEDALDDAENSSQDEGGGTVGPGPGLDNETMSVVEELDATPLGLSGMAREGDGGNTVEIDMGLVFESEIESDLRETIRSTFGTGTEDTTFEFDGDRVTISGTFTADEEPES